MMPVRDIPLVSEIREAVEHTMETTLAQVEPENLRDALLHAAQGGKKIRPLVVCLACSAAGGSWKAALQSAAAVEFLHVSSLIHDDIMDISPLRRGKPTLHTLHGTAFAILAGDALIALAFDMLIASKGMHSARRLHVLTDAFRQLCQGQALDLMRATETECTTYRALQSAAGKTAALFQAAAEVGALHVTDAQHVITPLKDFGFALGMAFQARDDLLDVVGLEEMMGKPAHCDRGNGHLGWASPEADHETLERTRGVVEYYTRAAVEAVRRLPETPARLLLEHLAQSLAERVS